MCGVPLLRWRWPGSVAGDDAAGGGLVNIRDYMLRGKEWSLNVKPVSDSRFEASVWWCVWCV